MPVCRVTLSASTRVSGQIDTLAPLPRSGAALALLDHTRSFARFLPHDDLVLLRQHHTSVSTWHVPPYITPPGISILPSTNYAYVLLDTTLLQIDTANLRVLERWNLDLRALGWPAAILAGSAGRVYVVGQPRSLAPAAEVEALQVHGPALRVVWRRSLGLTHAGLWLGGDGPRLALYLPDAHDFAGTVELLNAATGTLVGRQFSIPTSPTALDPAQSFLYVNSGADVRALRLDDGAPVALVTGTAPLAVDGPGTLVAFARGRQLTVDTARTLRTLARLTFPNVTALAFAADGATLDAAQPDKVSYFALRNCAGD